MTGTKTTLTFNAKTHRYRLDGAPIRGVTGLISGGTENSALIKWAGNLIADFVVDEAEEFERMRGMLSRERLRWELRNIPDSKRDAAGVKGTEIHEIAHQLVHGTEVDVPERLLEYVQGYAQFLERFKVRPVLTERPVANREHWYAGTFDLLAYLDRLGPELWMIDLKTSRGVYGTVALQTAGYARAEMYVDAAGFEVPMPMATKHGVVHVTPDGCDLYDLGPIDEAFAEFLSVQHTAKTTRRRKALTEVPVILQ